MRVLLKCLIANLFISMASFAIAESDQHDAAIQTKEEKVKISAIRTRLQSFGDAFCEVYGRAIRGDPIGYEMEDIPGIVELVRAEAKRRKIKFKEADILERKIRIGLNYCELFAIWDLTPSAVNSSVGSWGKHTQIVYQSAGLIIYMTNNRVSSWQTF